MRFGGYLEWRLRNTVTAAERIIIMMILTTLLSFLFLLHVLSQNLYFHIGSRQNDKNSLTDKCVWLWLIFTETRINKKNFYSNLYSVYFSVFVFESNSIFIFLIGMHDKMARRSKKFIADVNHKVMSHKISTQSTNKFCVHCTRCSKTRKEIRWKWFDNWG